MFTGPNESKHLLFIVNLRVDSLHKYFNYEKRQKKKKT